MRFGPRRQEWLVAATVLVTSAATAWHLHQHANEVDAASERRRAQLDRLVELSQAATVPAGGARAVAGLFADHDVVVARAPWGTQLALETGTMKEPR